MVDTDQLLCLFSAEVTRQNGAAVIEIPEQELDVGAIRDGKTYRVGMYETAPSDQEKESQPSPTHSRQSERQPPVEEGDQIDVEIEDMGEEGDGIARVGPGYIVFVPDTEVGERVSIELTSVRENVAFGEVVERHDR